MDHLSRLPDLIVQDIFSYLAPKDAARLSSVSHFFQSHSSQIFSVLCTQYNIITSSPIQDFGKVYSCRCKFFKSWNAEDSSSSFLSYNLVKSIKFGTDFTAVLQYNGNLISNIMGAAMEVNDTSVLEMDACMFGIIYRKSNKEVFWIKKSGGELVKTRWEGEEPAVISASIYGILGFSSGKVEAFDRDYSRQVNFPVPITAGIKEIRSTPKMLLILTGELKVYSCGLITFDAVLINLNPVRLISVGNSHSLAVVQRPTTPIAEWSTETLMTFMAKNGFEDCCQLIKHHEIDGSDIEDLSDTYFIETLGIREPDRRHKLKYLLKESNRQSFESKFEIVGWGSNKNLQLGPEGHVINHPIKLSLPALAEDEKIDSIQCDKEFSYLLTSHGRVFALGGKKGNKMTKVEKKGIVWEEITNRIIDKGKIVGIQCSHLNMGVVYRFENKAKVKVKMRMAENIVEMINNGKVSFEAYEVGYLDRFLGILEMSFEQFLKVDVPKHRIQYFKRNGKVVWDRRARIDNF